MSTEMMVTCHGCGEQFVGSLEQYTAWRKSHSCTPTRKEKQ